MLLILFKSKMHKDYKRNICVREKKGGVSWSKKSRGNKMTPEEEEKMKKKKKKGAKDTFVFIAIFIFVYIH